MLFELDRSRWVWITRTRFLHSTLAFTIVSGLHYVFVVWQRLPAHSATPAKSAARQRAYFDRISFAPLELMILIAVLISPCRCGSITQCLQRSRSFGLCRTTKCACIVAVRLYTTTGISGTFARSLRWISCGDFSGRAATSFATL